MKVISLRQSQLPSAHSAETEDIVETFKLLDILDLLGAFKSAAVNRGRLPKYCPEELNVCSMADRQSRLDMKSLYAQSVTDTQLSVNVVSKERVNKLSAACDKNLSFSDIL